MTLSSMTGFGRAEGALGPWRWHWEIKTVNARGLDMRLRMPHGLEALEPRLRDMLQAAFKRGACQVSLNIDREGVEPEVRINRHAVANVMTELRALSAEFHAGPPQLENILALRGMMEVIEPEETEAEKAARLEALAESFAGAVASLAASRRSEGERLLTILTGVVDEIERLAAEAGKLAATQPETLRARLEKQVTELIADRAGVTPDRIAQEVAVLATKADVREELDRLAAHIAQARDLLSSGEAVGRKLDFLAQEFNREANTLCSKSADTDLTRIGLDLKAAIDQLREQVQNVE